MDRPFYWKPTPHRKSLVLPVRVTQAHPLGFTPVSFPRVSIANVPELSSVHSKQNLEKPWLESNTSFLVESVKELDGVVSTLKHNFQQLNQVNLDLVQFNSHFSTFLQSVQLSNQCFDMINAPTIKDTVETEVHTEVHTELEMGMESLNRSEPSPRIFQPMELEPLNLNHPDNLDQELYQTTPNPQKTKPTKKLVKKKVPKPMVKPMVKPKVVVNKKVKTNLNFEGISALLPLEFRQLPLNPNLEKILFTLESHLPNGLNRNQVMERSGLVQSKGLPYLTTLFKAKVISKQMKGSETLYVLNPQLLNTS